LYESLFLRGEGGRKKERKRERGERWRGVQKERRGRGREKQLNTWSTQAEKVEQASSCITHPAIHKITIHAILSPPLPLEEKKKGEKKNRKKEEKKKRRKEEKKKRRQKKRRKEEKKKRRTEEKKKRRKEEKKERRNEEMKYLKQIPVVYFGQ
jgi:hypothetical protein